MQLVWTLPAPEEQHVPPIEAFVGRYQDMLRALGGWLDARSYRLTGISGSGDCLLIEVETGSADDPMREAFRLTYDALERLVQASHADRERFR